MVSEAVSLKVSELKPPQSLKLDGGSLSENWRKFEQKFRLYLTVSKIEEEVERIQVSTLLHVVGGDALEVYNAFHFGRRDGDTASTILKR